MEQTVDQVFLNYHQRKNVGRNANRLKKVYMSFTDAQKIEFKTLLVERQMYLLSVPLKKQAFFKRTGVDEYIAQSSFVFKPQGAKAVNFSKQEEQRIHRHVADGGFVSHERNEEAGKNKQGH
jgi:hypothetical protein